METFASQTSIFLVALSQRKRRPCKPSTVALWTSLSHNWIVRLYARSPHGGVQPRFCPGQGGKIQLEMENLRSEQRPTTRKQKSVASAAAIIPVTVAGFALLKCGCAFAAFTIEIVVGLIYFLWIAF
ncbi:MAG: hypothetical protein DMG30_03680 [Acidobacteria bacterium]|nr:MAG: hypothetical protein DMG30_03680 [Acidobacteriota bacterium]